MVVSTFSLCPNPASGVCSTHVQSSFEFDLFSGRSSSPPSSAAAPHSVERSSTGGLSCLFSSASQSLEREELASLKHDRTDDFKCGGKYLGGSYLKSPVSVLQSPLSSSPSSSVAGSSPLKIGLCNAIGSHPMFKGFATHALGPCVEYDAPQIGGDFAEDEELTFDMDELTPPDPCVKEILADAQSRHSIFFDELAIKAFYEAERAHRGQMRASGDLYLNHCVETAVLLATIGANSTVVAAGLLHDTIDDSFLSYDSMLRTFGEGVADLVKGVSKLSYLSKLARDNDIAGRNVEADRLHTMFLAMADPSAVLVKLADRLHNMKTLGALPLIKRQRFAKETFEIFVPLANRLGISTWKEQLENLCFEHLNSDQHHLLDAQLHETFDEELITCVSQKLQDALVAEKVPFNDLYGRHKSLFSIYTKMMKKNVEMREIHDIHGLRLIVGKEEDCYKAMDLVHKMWRQVPGQYKDYVAHPKVNGYRSLHTVVQGDDTLPFEVQIRTQEMHLQAEIGIAAHWRYKEGNCKHSSFVVQMVEWARWVLTWQCHAMKDSLPCSFPRRSEDCPVYVIVIENDKVSVQELAANATVGDVVERAGHRFPVSVRVSCADVTDHSRKLEMGDVVEVGPRRRSKSLMEFREEFQRMYNRSPLTKF